MSLQRSGWIRANRTRKQRMAAAIARVESLETRCMLTTLVGPGAIAYVDPTTGMRNVQVLTADYYFRNAADDVFQVTVGGNVTAEFVAGVVDATTQQVTLRNLVGENEPDPADPNQKLKGADIFAIYVQKADLDSFIAISRVTRDQNSGKLTLEPFTESAGQLRISSAKDGKIITVDTLANTGKLYLGARTGTGGQQGGGGQQQGQDNIPIVTATVTAPIGILPVAVGQRLNAGLVVADGQNLGKFLFGGTITGRVSIGGSMNVFACGNLLTGVTGGTQASSEPSPVPNNFYVKGDLRDLLVVGAIGTHSGAENDNPSYLTRFELKVDGRLGQVRAYDSFTGTATVLGREGVSINSLTEIEIETRGSTVDASSTAAFDSGHLTDPVFYNDSPDAAQYLGSFTSAEMAENNAVQVRGVLAGTDKIADFADYYAVALMAGQTVQVQLIDLNQVLGAGAGPVSQSVAVGVFDPDGRLIATNYSNVDRLNTEWMPFRFTTDRPGLYRFAIGLYGETAFAGTPGPQVTFRSTVPYELRLSNVGRITLGAVAATNNILDPNYSAAGFTVESGDLGALVAGGTFMSYSKTLPLDVIVGMQPVSVEVLDGGLRTIQGGGVGLVRNNAMILGPNVHVPNGDVGLVRSTAGVLVLNGDYVPADYIPDPNLVDDPTIPVVPLPIVGGDYQMVDAATSLYGNIITNQRIGVVRAGDMATRSASTLMANADLAGDDGIIDLIDVAGNVGTLAAGGPHIYTGPKGNLRYMNVGGTAYRDTVFGSGPSIGTPYAPGESVTLNDDSGSEVTISPTSATGVLTLTTYGIRGSGGVAIIRVEANSGVTITGSSEAELSAAEIGSIRIAPGTAGPGLVTLANGQLALDPAAPQLAVTLTGRGRVDALSIVGPRFARISNTTGGEIVSVLADSIGRIEANTLGIASHNTASAVLPQGVMILNTYPFLQQRTAIIASDILVASARGALGNIVASPALAADAGTRLYAGYGGGGGTGTLQQLIPDNDNTRSKTTFEGIVGPIYASNVLGTIYLGAGIPFGGSGDVALSGLFAGGTIRRVEGALGADVRGPIAASAAINSIRLVSGSLINADVLVVSNLADARRSVFDKALAGGAAGTFQLGSVLIEGGRKTTTTTPNKNTARRVRKDLRGNLPGGTPTPPPAYLPSGIMGSKIWAMNIGTVKVNGGYGILNCDIGTTGPGVIDRIEADGYGIRDTVIESGVKINYLIAKGDGSLAPITEFSTSVRYSEVAGGDPNSPVAPNRTNDLYVFLDLPVNKPSAQYKTNTGMMSGVQASALRDLGLLQAWRFDSVRANPKNPLVVPPQSTLNFANSIKKIDIAQDVNNVQIVTGGIKQFFVGQDVIDLDMTVAGPIWNIWIGRDMWARFNKDSKIHAIGPNGNIRSIQIDRNFAGLIMAEHKIGKILIKGRWTGRIIENGVLRTK